MIEIRPARSTDIKGIRKIIDTYAPQGRLLSKETVTLYESVQEFTVAIENNEVVGCGALHVLWEDLAEVRTVAVAEHLRRNGVGHLILEAIISRARDIGVSRIFCLTFETQFFGRHGFEEIEGTPVEPEVYKQLLHSYDTGIAEFLDLESVKPNTLGNTRMLKHL
ncbi:MAG: amino-acid N-acetyltransferase [Actinobacteria bacterium]|nr:amino-acid N-acetyltransferase [Actinomycetota bacterium]TRZ84169.1 MAG: amino-acid N-acetyltransferase [Streptomycetaceae bacterium]MSW57997.1 amino-acid N-acetyltransferase [Actinomycetota bacterium]MSX48650.1 amino-acid N-acetyltransferase [Actinomycetota bacterium]MSX62746.1 amino-acid N-acetyltransferase [Actinomycetota bacterium]